MIYIVSGLLISVFIFVLTQIRRSTGTSLATFSQFVKDGQHEIVCFNCVILCILEREGRYVDLYCHSRT